MDRSQPRRPLVIQAPRQQHIHICQGPGRGHGWTPPQSSHGPPEWPQTSSPRRAPTSHPCCPATRANTRDRGRPVASHDAGNAPPPPLDYTPKRSFCSLKCCSMLSEYSKARSVLDESLQEWRICHPFFSKSDAFAAWQWSVVHSKITWGGTTCSSAVRATKLSTPVCHRLQFLAALRHLLAHGICPALGTTECPTNHGWPPKLVEYHTPAPTKPIAAAPANVLRPVHLESMAHRLRKKNTQKRRKRTTR